MEPTTIVGSNDLAATFRDQASRVRAIAFRILHDQAEAEDVVQDTFAAAWRLAPSYDPSRGSRLTWLRCMARSRAIDRLRVRQANERTLALLPQPSPTAKETPGREERERLHEALGLLPAKQRDAVELAYFTGLTHQEIATRTGSPLGTVKTRLRLGLQRLAALLSDA